MDATQCLTAVASRLGLRVPEGGVSAAFITGRIMERLDVPGPYAELAAAVICEVDMMVQCNNETNSPDECFSVLGDRLSHWQRHLYNLKKYGTNDPDEIAAILQARRTGSE